MYIYKLKREWKFLMFDMKYKHHKGDYNKSYRYHNLFIKLSGVKFDTYDGHRVVHALSSFKDTYSPTRLNHLEFIGYMIPINFFDEIKI